MTSVYQTPAESDTNYRNLVVQHVAAICDRNPPILSELEDRWNSLTSTFAFTRERYSDRMSAIYDPLVELSGRQCALASIDDYADVIAVLKELADVTSLVDEHIAKLFQLLSEIENKCFKSVASRGDAQ
ncbi:MAG: hypothetical protein IBJ07_06515 [Rhizobiaceae bacterium]|nr:hypothetical protein [Rhizobiaceae bacterium]